jgi:large exoprotein involved in heme utilization and adhesion
MTGSFLLAGIESGLGSDNSKAGNIEVNATGVINLNNSSFINNGVRADANGQGGDVNISASTLQVEGGAQVSASTLGAGKGGNLSVDAKDVQLIGTSADGQVSALATAAQPNSTGNAGDLTLKTSTLQVKDGAQVSTSTIGAGKGGNLTVDAKDIQLIGRSANGRFRSNLSASAQRNSTGDAGDLTIRTNTLQVKDGAQVSVGTSGTGKGGNLSVDAFDVQLIGKSSGLFAPSAQRNSTGDAGDLTIKTNTLLVRDGAQVFTGTFGAGKGGNLSVDAKDVQLIGRSADGQIASALGTAAQSNSTGDAGDLTIKTNTLLVQDGAQVFTATSGAGNGGNLSVDAQNVQLIGFYAETPSVYTPSGLFANADIGAIGNGGNITIEAHKLLVQDAALIFAGTRTDLTSPSNGGSVTINVQQLRLQNGGQIGTGTRSAGRGGNLQVNADTVQLVGFRLVGTDKYPSSLFSDSIAEVTGDAGDLTIKTNTLLVQDEAQISVESSGTGTAGSMTLNARSIRLDNNALLSANTQSAKFDPNREQATININSRDLIMRRGSNITTNATGENVIGGNINIDTDVLAAFENSDISANSTNFRGGNVRINAQGIFGTQFRDVASDRTSDITATGASPEFSGNVEINTPDIDPDSGLVNLPTVPVDTEVAQSCTAGGTVAKSQFTVTGRGGLPPNPGEPLSTDAVQVDLITLNPSSNNRNSPTVTSKTTTATPERIVEATGWIINEKGEVVLIANAPTTTPHSPWYNQPDCRAS